MSERFDKVMANLRESLRHATPEEDGQPSYCMVRKDELDALIGCAEECKFGGYYKYAIERLEACADE